MGIMDSAEIVNFKSICRMNHATKFYWWKSCDLILWHRRTVNLGTDLTLISLKSQCANRGTVPHCLNIHILNPSSTFRMEVVGIICFKPSILIRPGYFRQCGTVNSILLF
jgi:hypothetical protein